VKKIIVLFTF